MTAVTESLVERLRRLDKEATPVRGSLGLDAVAAPDQRNGVESYLYDPVYHAVAQTLTYTIINVIEQADRDAALDNARTPYEVRADQLLLALVNDGIVASVVATLALPELLRLVEAARALLKADVTVHNSKGELGALGNALRPLVEPLTESQT